MYPAEISKSLLKQVMLLNETVINKLGYKFGMTHSDYIIDKDNNIFLIESANRGGGCFTSQLIVTETSGVDIVKFHINSCLGYKNIKPSKIEFNPVLLKFFELDPGMISNINISENISKDERVLEIRLNINSGEEVKAISSDANRHGFIIIRGEAKLREDFSNILKTYLSYDYA